MLKEIFATVLLSTCTASKSLVPKEASINQLLGAYVLRDDFNNYYDHQATEEIIINDAFWFYDYEKHAYVNSHHLSILVDDLLGFIIVDDNAQQTYSYTALNSDTLHDLDASLSRLVLYFDVPVYLDYNLYNLFTSFMVKDGNEFVKPYLGWFTFSNYVNNNVYYNLFGNLSVNNNLVIALDYFESGSNIKGVFYTGSQEIVYEVYNSSGWVGSKLVYISALIPDNLEAVMISTGSFQYIPTVDRASFMDLMFSIADAPVKLLTDIFNFNLLGVNFAMAILSIISLAIMITIFKFVIAKS